MVNLAEGIQGLVTHMRSEQQMIRAWVEEQTEEAREMRQVLMRLVDPAEAAGSLAQVRAPRARRAAARDGPAMSAGRPGGE